MWRKGAKAADLKAETRPKALVTSYIWVGKPGTQADTPVARGHLRFALKVIYPCGREKYEASISLNNGYAVGGQEHVLPTPPGLLITTPTGGRRIR